MSHYQDRANFIQLWKIQAQGLAEAAELVWNGKVIRHELPNGETGEIQELAGPAELLMGI